MNRDIMHNGYRKTVPAKHAEILVKLGKAAYVQEDPAPEPTAKNTETKAPHVQTKALRAETASDKPGVKTVKPKRKYKRRDMNAKNTETK